MPSLLGQIAPAGARQINHLLGHAVEVNGRQQQLWLVLAIKFPHARDGFRHVLDGTLDGAEVIARPRAQIGLLLQE